MYLYAYPQAPEPSYIRYLWIK